MKWFVEVKEIHRITYVLDSDLDGIPERIGLPNLMRCLQAGEITLDEADFNKCEISDIEILRISDEQGDLFEGSI